MNGHPDLVAEVEKLLAAGDGRGALRHCRDQVAARPGDPEGHRHLALLLMAAGNPLAAERAAERACSLAPADARCWSDFGRVQAMQGRFARAVPLFLRAVNIDSGNADAWHNLGMALQRQGRAETALASFKRALAIDRERAETWLALGALLVDAGQFDDAVECYERAARHDPTLARAHSRLAGRLAARGRLQRAEKLFRDSLALDTDHLPGWLGLGTVLEDIGDADAARACYRNVLARHDRQPHALGRHLALLEEPDEAAAYTASRFLDDAQAPDEARALVGYGLARYHERRGDIARSAAASRAANAARRRGAGPLDRAALAARVDGIITTCTRAFFDSRRRFGLGNEQPVFIVGLPRSGTTLTEQVLGRHPLVHGAGELNDLARIAAGLAPDARSPWTAVLTLDEARSRACATRYLEALRADAPRGRLRYVDKAPLNFFHLGFVALLFPQARVIHCTRDARDNALSVWMENFNAHQRYATDFDDLAFFRAQYRRLMAHWREQLPLPIFECRYEDTVQDLPEQARRLTEFLQLPWDSRCLRFHDQARAVRTPSRWQVRQPVYTSSVGRWRRFQDDLPELAQAFRSDD